MKKYLLLILLIGLGGYGNITNASNSFCENGRIPYEGKTTNINTILAKEGDTKKIQLMVDTLDELRNDAGLFSVKYINENLISSIYNYICNGDFKDEERLLLVDKMQKYIDNRLMYTQNVKKYYLLKYGLVDEKYRLNLINIDRLLSKDRLPQILELPVNITDWKKELKTAELDSEKFFQLIKNAMSDKYIKGMLTDETKISNYCLTGNIPLNDGGFSMESILKEEGDSKKIIIKVKAVSKNMDNKGVYSLDYVKKNKLTTINKYICKNSLSLEQQNVLVTKLQTYLNERVAYNEHLYRVYALKEAYSDKKYREKMLKAEMKFIGSKGEVRILSDNEIKIAYQDASNQLNSTFATVIKIIKSDKDIRGMFGLK